jgi:glycosidase
MSEKGATIEGLKLANTFVLTTRGVPQLYYGDELAMTGPDEPTTRKDFPGGFAGDKRNAFTREGRTTEQQEVFQHIQKLTRLRRELEPLRRGKLVNLHVTEQQYAYARQSGSGVVIVVINNDTKPAAADFAVTRLSLDGSVLFTDRMGVVPDTRVSLGRLRVTVPARSAAILVRR